ncbi:MAG: hypothetical protein JST82_09490 [Bacteroidetes bacterium]|nr:hypothetical protein [Bacteroidota bacterium]
MQYSNLSQKITAFLTKEFPEVVSSIETTEYGGTITSFMLRFKNEEDLLKLWEQIVGEIALRFQMKLSFDFEKWNIYLFFIVTGNVTRETKYKIENDPVSSRKIVVDNYRDQTPQQIIADHITNDNLNLIAADANTGTELVKNPLIEEILKKFIPTGTVKRKKGNDPSVLQALTELETRMQP